MNSLSNITFPYTRDGYSYHYEPTKRDKVVFSFMSLILFLANEEFRQIVKDVNYKHLGSHLFQRKLSLAPVPDNSDVPFDMEKN